MHFSHSYTKQDLNRIKYDVVASLHDTMLSSKSPGSFHILGHLHRLIIIEPRESTSNKKLNESIEDSNSFNLDTLR